MVTQTQVIRQQIAGLLLKGLSLEQEQVVNVYSYDQLNQNRRTKFLKCSQN